MAGHLVVVAGPEFAGTANFIGDGNAGFRQRKRVTTFHCPFVKDC